MPFRFGYLAIRFALGLMRTTLRSMRSGERGFVGPEIALITMALGSGVFATAVINSGTLSADRLNQVLHRSLDQVSGSLEVRGDVVVTAKGAPLHSDTIQFTLGSFGTLQPLALDPAAEGGLVISYRDSNAIASNVPYTARFGANSNGDNKLDDGEIATISIKVSDIEAIAGQKVLPLGKRWTLDLESPSGPSLEFTRTQPPVLTAVMAQP